MRSRLLVLILIVMGAINISAQEQSGNFTYLVSRMYVDMPAFWHSNYQTVYPTIPYLSSTRLTSRLSAMIVG